MGEIRKRIERAVCILEEGRERLGDRKFLKFCKLTKREILGAFEEGKLSKEEIKPLLSRVNTLLDSSDIYRKEEGRKFLKIMDDAGTSCPRCHAPVRSTANFCRRCGYRLR